MNQMARAWLVLCLLACSTHAARIRHRDLDQLPASSAQPTRNCSITEPWNNTQTWSTFPLANFPSLCSAIGFNLSADAQYGSLTAIDLRNGNVEWTMPFTGFYNGVNLQASKGFLSNSVKFSELYYAQRSTLTADAATMCTQVMAFRFRSTTAIWQHQWCYDFDIGLTAQLFVFPFRDREILFVADGLIGNHTFTAIDGLKGAILTQSRNLAFDRQTFEQRGDPSQALFAIVDERDQTASLYAVNEVGAWKPVCRNISWDAAYSTLDGINNGGTAMVVSNPQSALADWIAIDLLTNRTLWATATSNISLFTGSWIVDYIGYHITEVAASAHPTNPEWLIVTSRAANETETNWMFVAGIVNTNTGALMWQTPVLGPLAGPYCNYDIPMLWSATDDNTLVMTLYVGSVMLATSNVWYAFTQNLTLIGLGPIEIPSTATVAMFVDVSGNSTSLVFSAKDGIHGQVF